MYTWVSCADFFYFALDIINGSNRGDRNLKRMRISGELDADKQRHEVKGQVMMALALTSADSQRLNARPTPNAEYVYVYKWVT